MKIGILTQPLRTNYGGILQNYALQTVLKKMGHDPWTIRTKDSMYWRYRCIASRFTKDKILRKNDIPPSQDEHNIISKNLTEFVEENINLTEEINFDKEKDKLEKYGFDAFIVGSDQVWRPRYNRKILNNYFDFLDDYSKAKKIAYAASFGVDEWEYSEKHTKQCRKLIKRFDAVSVREESGKVFCKNKFNINAAHVLDPSLLLNKNDYVKLINNFNYKDDSKILVTYILDECEEKNSIINKISNKYGLEVQSIMPPKKYNRKNRVNLENCIFPTVEEFITKLINANYIITDSFHGTVFSVIFKRPFIVIGNKRRGISRLDSLLKKLKLEHRLLLLNYELSGFDDSKTINNYKIDVAISYEQEKSLKYLFNALS